MKGLIIGLLITLTSSAFAESDIKACGQLAYEYSKARNSKAKQFSVYTKKLRFELNTLSPQQIALLKRFSVRAGKRKVVGVCVKGNFGGNFRHSGFATGSVKLSRMTIYASSQVVYHFYKNYSF